MNDKFQMTSVESIRHLTFGQFVIHHCPRGAAWSARLPVTQEIVGSNPIGDAGRISNDKCGISTRHLKFEI